MANKLTVWLAAAAITIALGTAIVHRQHELAEARWAQTVVQQHTAPAPVANPPVTIPKSLPPAPKKPLVTKPAPKKVAPPKARQPLDIKPPAAKPPRGYSCETIRWYAAHISPSILETLAEKYGVTPAERKAAEACLKQK